MSEDDTGREKPSNGRRGRQTSKARASSAIARPKAPQRPRVSSRATRKAAAEQDETVQPVEVTGQPTEETGRPADDAAAPTPEQPLATNPDSEAAPVAAKSAGSGIPDGQAPAEKPTKRRSPARKTSASTTSAASEAQEKPSERRKAASGTRQGATRRRPAGPRTRGDDGGPPTSTADVAQSVGPADASGSPPIDPMAELAGLAERSLHESLQSLRSVTESRSLSELLERQSRHMRLMSEIWVRQAQRSMEVFNAMLVQRRR